MANVAGTVREMPPIPDAPPKVIDADFDALVAHWLACDECDGTFRQALAGGRLCVAGFRLYRVWQPDGRSRPLPADSHVPCPHDDEPKVGRGACRLCYMKWYNGEMRKRRHAVREHNGEAGGVKV